MMGRHKAMPPAPEPDPPPPLIPGLEPVPDRVRRMTRRTLLDPKRYESLKSKSINRPPGPLRSAAMERAALVQAHTPPIDEQNDGKNVRIIAQMLYDEGLVAGYVDEQRALTRHNIDFWLFHSAKVSERSLSVYRRVMYLAGATLYPREFPSPMRTLATRQRATPPAPPGTAEELYALVPSVPESIRKRLLLVLDLITGAGLRTQEIREITGSDVAVLQLPGGREIIEVRVRRRGKVDRRVPVLCPHRGHRLLTHATEVGTGTFFPLMSNGRVYKNIVSKLNDRLREYGFAGLDAVALRNRWIMDLAVTPGISTAAVLYLAGAGDLRVVADQPELLPKYSPEDLATMLLEAHEKQP